MWGVCVCVCMNVQCECGTCVYKCRVCVRVCVCEIQGVTQSNRHSHMV